MQRLVTSCKLIMFVLSSFSSWYEWICSSFRDVRQITPIFIDHCSTLACFRYYRTSFTDIIILYIFQAAGFSDLKFTRDRNHTAKNLIAELLKIFPTSSQAREYSLKEIKSPLLYCRDVQFYRACFTGINFYTLWPVYLWNLGVKSYHCYWIWIILYYTPHSDNLISVRQL